MSDWLEQRTDVDRQSIQTVRNVVECSGDYSITQPIVNDLVILWTPGAASKTLSLPESDNRTGIEVTVCSLDSTNDGEIDSDGALVLGLPAGSNIKLIWLDGQWRPVFGDELDLSNIPTAYYAPVSGEESIGTPVYFNDTTARTHYDGSVTTSWETADFSSYLPADAKAVIVQIDLVGGGTTGGLLVWKNNNLSLSTGQAWVLGLGSLVLNSPGGVRDTVFQTIVLDENRQFQYGEYNNSSWAVYSVNFALLGYYV